MKCMYRTSYKNHYAVTTLRVVWIEISLIMRSALRLCVTTLRVVWIEIYLILIHSSPNGVTTLRVVWIEIAGR